VEIVSLKPPLKQLILLPTAVVEVVSRDLAHNQPETVVLEEGRASLTLEPLAVYRPLTLVAQLQHSPLDNKVFLEALLRITTGAQVGEEQAEQERLRVCHFLKGARAVLEPLIILKPDLISFMLVEAAVTHILLSKEHQAAAVKAATVVTFLVLRTVPTRPPPTDLGWMASEEAEARGVMEAQELLFLGILILL